VIGQELAIKRSRNDWCVYEVVRADTGAYGRVVRFDDGSIRKFPTEDESIPDATEAEYPS
jgi:hypothetical protein